MKKRGERKGGGNDWKYIFTEISLIEEFKPGEWLIWDLGCFRWEEKATAFHKGKVDSSTTFPAAYSFYSYLLRIICSFLPSNLLSFLRLLFCFSPSPFPFLPTRISARLLSVSSNVYFTRPYRILMSRCMRRKFSPELSNCSSFSLSHSSNFIIPLWLCGFEGDKARR